MDETARTPDLHTIRLMGPWRVHALAQSHEMIPLVSTVRLPLSNECDIAVGALCLERNFQRPGRLDPDERVLLILPAGAVPVSIHLGETLVTEPRRLGASRAWDLTQFLRPSNRLRLEFDGGDWRSALQQPIQLGILSDAEDRWWSGLPLA